MSNPKSLKSDNFSLGGGDILGSNPKSLNSDNFSLGGEIFWGQIQSPSILTTFHGGGGIVWVEKGKLEFLNTNLSHWSLQMHHR